MSLAVVPDLRWILCHGFRFCSCLCEAHDTILEAFEKVGVYIRSKRCRTQCPRLPTTCSIKRTSAKSSTCSAPTCAHEQLRLIRAKTNCNRAASTQALSHDATAHRYNPPRQVPLTAMVFRVTVHCMWEDADFASACPCVSATNLAPAASIADCAR